ncbi:MAG: hypothetical protein EPO65_11995 [Dehalococcoidia bacterium]|nr:MAG: hypothetical protein EPO65_11995 [Dehalococcoidia bacterium]
MQERFSPGGALAGLLAIALGVLSILDAAESIDLEPRVMWPAGLLGLGVVLVVEAVTRRDEHPPA